MIVINSKGQSALEFLTTYGWILLVVVVAIGVLFYFDVLDPQNYVKSECFFSTNFYCQQYSIKKIDNSNIKVSVILRNNLERAIKPVSFRVYDKNNDELSCSVSVYCPHTNDEPNWAVEQGFGSHHDLREITVDAKWNPSILCLIESNCLKQTIAQTKEDFSVHLEFKRKDGSTSHTVIGRIYSEVQ